MTTIPHNYEPRLYQEPLFDCIADGYKRGVGIWHRRAGKDKTLLNLMTKEACKRVGVYYYFFPTYNQGRKVLWDGIDRQGFGYMDHIPEEIRENTNQAEMKIKLVNGSLIQIIGTDNIDAIMGTNPIGCVFSEYSLQNPDAWDLIRPILAENGGWAVFNYTPRGRNHGYVLYEMAKHNPDWFCQLLTIDDTGAVSPDVVQAEREAGMSEEMIKQEFYCSFEAALSQCFFAGALDGHDCVKTGQRANIVKGEIVSEDTGLIEFWRYPYKMLKGYDDLPWLHRYCIGSDISEGLDGDYSVAYVYDRYHKEHIARMSSNKIDSYKWGDRLYALSLLFDNALIVPERNGAGITTINRLIKLNANLYVKEIIAAIGKQVTKQWGFLETKESKQSLCGGLKAYLGREKKPKVYDRTLLQECAVFIKDEEKETLGAEVGFHDDHVIAAALCLIGDTYLPKCEKVKPEPTGWLKRWQEEKKDGSVWAQ